MRSTTLRNYSETKFTVDRHDVMLVQLVYEVARRGKASRRERRAYSAGIRGGFQPVNLPVTDNSAWGARYVPVHRLKRTKATVEVMPGRYMDLDYKVFTV